MSVVARSTRVGTRVRTLSAPTSGAFGGCIYEAGPQCSATGFGRYVFVCLWKRRMGRTVDTDPTRATSVTGCSPNCRPRMPFWPDCLLTPPFGRIRHHAPTVAFEIVSEDWEKGLRSPVEVRAARLSRAGDLRCRGRDGCHHRSPTRRAAALASRGRRRACAIARRAWSSARRRHRRVGADRDRAWSCREIASLARRTRTGRRPDRRGTGGSAGGGASRRVAMSDLGQFVVTPSAANSTIPASNASTFAVRPASCARSVHTTR